jgi:Chaperone of endosialidase
MNPLIQLKKAIPAILVVLACFALSPQARAVCHQGCGFGDENTFLGDDALVNDQLGVANTAIGFEALSNNIDGSQNTATGYLAMQSNTDGLFNTATGATALAFNRTGHFNTATGANALLGNRTGRENTATGESALVANQTGNNNTATGSEALHNTTGSNNIALGKRAGFNLTSGNNNIDIGAFGAASDSNTIRIGTQSIRYNTYIQGISGVAVTGSQVVVAPNGKLGVIISSARFKQDIEPMDKASEAVLALKPVTFHYKKEVDPNGIPQFGLIAEQVEKVNPDLVARDKGKVYTVRYDAVNAMLLNEFLKAHRHVEEQDAIIARQQKQIDALSTALQKVSAQIELSKAGPQTVLNNH